MTLDHDPSRPRRTAELRLRAPGGPLEARGYWPAAVWPPLCVTFGVAPAVAAQLCVTAGVVVLAADPATDAAGCAVLGWAADHLADLGAGGSLLLAGQGAGAGRAQWAAAHAARAGWPVLRHVFLIASAPMSKSAPLVRRSSERAPSTVPTTVIAPGPDATTEFVAAAEHVVQDRPSPPKGSR